MNKLIPRISIFVTALAATLLLPVSASAQVDTPGLLVVHDPAQYHDLQSILNVLGGVVRPVVILTFLVMLTYGGWVRMTARASSDRLEYSNRIITAAIIGFAIIVMAPVIIQFIGSLLGVQGGII